ncbi:hypothetical protein L210DRAFT_2174159, partial [Boletus edulis BED1]
FTRLKLEFKLETQKLLRRLLQVTQSVYAHPDSRFHSPCSPLAYYRVVFSCAAASSKSTACLALRVRIALCGPHCPIDSRPRVQPQSRLPAPRRTLIPAHTDDPHMALRPQHFRVGGLLRPVHARRPQATAGTLIRSNRQVTSAVASVWTLTRPSNPANGPHPAYAHSSLSSMPCAIRRTRKCSSAHWVSKSTSIALNAMAARIRH